MRETVRLVGSLLALAVAWEIVGRINPGGYDVLSTPTRILAQFWQDADLYRPHVAATVRSALIGFALGNTVAILAALAFCRFPLLEILFRGVNITLFAVPPIVVGPVLVLVFGGDLPQILLSALIVYFPTMAAMLVGLRQIDPRLVDVIHLYGGREPALVRFVRLRSSLPSLLAGLRIAASLAVLGAVLGEFGSGVRWGLGTFLLGSLGQGNTARLWGICLTATALALAGYGLFAWIGNRVVGTTVAVTIAANRLPDEIGGAGRYNRAQRLLLLAGSILLPFVLWSLMLRVTHLSPIIAPGPIDTLRYLTIAPDAAEARGALLAALAQTLPLAALGFASGLAAAFLLAALSVVRPGLVKALLPIAMVAQATPLVALVPIVLLAFGRDTLASLFMAVLVVFFPAFVLLAQGFAQVPRAGRELVQAYGGSAMKELLLVSIPYASRYLYEAAKLVAPRALLGVMVAEWLLSGTGLGNLLNTSRGSLDYGMVWAGALVSILISIAAYQAIALAERLARW